MEQVRAIVGSFLREATYDDSLDSILLKSSWDITQIHSVFLINYPGLERISASSLTTP